MSGGGSRSLAEELNAIRARLADAEPEAREPAERLLDHVRTILEQLAATEAELERRDAELASSEQAVETAARRYQVMFDEAPVPFLTTDEAGKILEANPAAAELLGVELRFLLAKPLPIYVDRKELRAFRVRLAALSASGGRDYFTVRVRRRDGVPFDVTAQVSVVGGVLRWVLRDITAERLAEERMWELNRALEAEATEKAGTLHAVLEQLPVGVLVADAATGLVTSSNAYVRGLAGGVLDPARHEDKASTSLVRRDGSAYLEEELPLARALRDGEVVEGELVELRSEAAEPHVVSMSAKPVHDEEGRVAAAVVVVEDVSERERRDRADRDFVSNAAHQLRTPLAAITGAIAVLQAGAKDDPTERDRFLEHLERESGRLAQLTGALLTLARAERAEEVPELEVVELGPLFDEVAARLPAPPDAVAMHIACETNAAVLANPALLQEAIGNLVANAVSYTTEGEIRLEAHAVDGVVVVDVVDTGPGIPAAEQARIFERFYRATRSRGGFGLGLPIAAAAIEACGGSLTIESTEGVGTSARVRLRAVRLVP